jgi:3-phenylpropionate/trans-cinnamate dioxygenase ferredoxin component
MSESEIESDFEFVATVDDVPDGQLLGVETARGERVCLANHRGEICALADECTHAEFPMSSGAVLPDGSVQCAWHGARFDRRTGAVRHGPAVDPLPVYEVRVEEGRIYVGPKRTT